MQMTLAGDSRTANPPVTQPDRANSESIGWVHILAVGVSALGFLFDLGELAFGSALSGVFSAPPYAVPPGQLAWLLSSLYLGAIIGPPLAGVLADRRGRRVTLIVILSWLAVTSVLGACSPGIAWLSAARGLSGIALGAFPPVMITYLTDLLPAKYRGTLIMVAVAAAYLGPPAIVFLLRWLTPLAPLGWAAWRWVLLVGGAGAAISAALYVVLPETPRWLASAARTGVLSRNSRLMPRHRGRFLLVVALSFLSPWATVAFPLLTGAILVMKGFALSDTLLYVGISTFGPFIGAITAAAGADRVERRTALVTCALGMIVAGTGFWLASAPLWLMTTSFVFNLCVSLYLPAISVYSAELFPTEIRARATSLAWSANRVAAALGPLVLLPWLRTVGIDVVFAVITGVMVASVLVILLFAPRGASGQPID